MHTFENFLTVFVFVLWICGCTSHCTFHGLHGRITKRIYITIFGVQKTNLIGITCVETLHMNHYNLKNFNLIESWYSMCKLFVSHVWNTFYFKWNEKWLKKNVTPLFYDAHVNHGCDFVFKKKTKVKVSLKIVSTNLTFLRFSQHKWTMAASCHPKNISKLWSLLF